jgi:DNA-binding XRE family transcriptional regulator
LICKGLAGLAALEYRKRIKELGLSQISAGQWLGVSPRTAQRWATEGPPEPVAKLLRLMKLLSLRVEDVD